MEIKNKLTVTRGEREGGQWEKDREGSLRNMYKGLMDKDNRGWGRIECGRWGWVGQEEVMGEKQGQQ